MRSHLGTAPKIIILLLLFAAIIFAQYGYDATSAVSSLSIPNSFSPGMIKIVDMGFDSTIASFDWVSTMPEILDLFITGHTEYLGDLANVNAIDPKLSYPYAFSVLTLPAVTNFPDGLKDSYQIGQEGIANADPDWRIPYYMATNYYLESKDTKDALIYYDIAARTPGIPQYAERFALNFGVGENERSTTIELWETIRDSTNDTFTKERAQAYIDRLDDLDYLEAAAKIYKQKYGVYPSSPNDLVIKGIIPAVPQDPFGFDFLINKDGSAAVNLTALPSYISAEPTGITN